MSEALDLDSRLRLMSLEERQRLALAQNAKIRLDQHRREAEVERKKMRLAIVELRRAGVSTRTIAMELGLSRSYISRFGRLPPVRSRTGEEGGG